MKDKKLTEKQRQFAADNHYVLENFLRYRGMPMDEFYDVVIFRFLKAVQQYDERKDLQKYKFSTIAEYAMRSAVSNYFAKKKRRDEKVEILSLDYQLGNSGMTLGDVIADESVDVCETVCKKFSQSVKKRRLLHRNLYKNVCLNTFENEAA